MMSWRARPERSVSVHCSSLLKNAHSLCNIAVLVHDSSKRARDASEGSSFVAAKALALPPHLKAPIRAGRQTSALNTHACQLLTAVHLLTVRS